MNPTLDMAIKMMGWWNTKARVLVWWYRICRLVVFLDLSGSGSFCSTPLQIFWITLSLALLQRQLRLSSSADGVIGLLVRIFPFQPCIICLIHVSFTLLSSLIFLKSSSFPSASSLLWSMMLRNVCFTILSSKLWKEITASLPPGARQSKQA